MARLFLVAGMPGAGKSTLSRALSSTHGAVHLETDAWLTAQGLELLDAPLRRRTERQLWRHARELLGHGVDVVLDLGAWSRLERERYRRGAREVGAEVELHCLDVPLEERLARVRARSAAAGEAASPTEQQQRDWEQHWQACDEAELAAYDPPLPHPAM